MTSKIVYIRLLFNVSCWLPASDIFLKKYAIKYKCSGKGVLLERETEAGKVISCYYYWLPVYCNLCGQKNAKKNTKNA